MQSTYLYDIKISKKKKITQQCVHWSPRCTVVLKFFENCISLFCLLGFPDEWLAENVANLLYLCGESIILKVLNSKAINGRMTELASIITSLSLVSRLGVLGVTT